MLSINLVIYLRYNYKFKDILFKKNFKCENPTLVSYLYFLYFSDY